MQFVSRRLAPYLFAALSTALLLGCPSTPVGTTCAPACSAVSQLCCRGATGAGTCVAFMSDSLNCGSCGNNCFGALCVSGVCIAGDSGPPRVDGGPPRDGGICPSGAGTRMCPSGIVNCSGFTGPVDGEGGRTDPSFTNCAACGRACDPAFHNRCATPGGGIGTPRCLCGSVDCGSAPGDICTLDAGTYRCIHTDTDRMNCGAIGTACTASETCSGGMCVCNAGTMEVCGAGETCCASACVDLTLDEGNCGMCGTSCPADEECVTAAGGPSECLCGGAMCDAAETCMAGTCVCNPTTGEICGAGESCCGTTCIDTSMDNTNCGGCGVVCGANTTCNTVAAVTGCYCGTDVCTPPGTMLGGPAGDLCCDDGLGTLSCVPQNGTTCRACGRMCDSAAETCIIAAPSPGDPPGNRPCCSGDIVPFFGFCSDDF